jgi:NB-ARC domain
MEQLQVVPLDADEPLSFDDPQMDSISKETPPSEADGDPQILTLIEEVDGVLGCLMRLVPSLCDPFPLDTYSSDSSIADAYPDIDLATAMFPNATLPLRERLGRANWRRRQYLKGLEENSRPSIPFASMASKIVTKRIKKSPLREIAVDAFNFQKPVLKKETPATRLLPDSRRIFAAPSTRAPSTVGESIFSRPTLGDTEAGTSIAETEAFIKQQTVPKPPIPLDSGRSFLCPYCNDEIDVGARLTSKDDWEDHVFGDLEPYICTYDSCLTAEKTFAARDEWFRHELENHRIMKVWVCQSCVMEFRSSQSFKEHLEQKHESICGPSQVAMMLSLCMKHSEKHLKEDNCPLCAMKLDLKALKAHVATHMEQLALTSINGDDSSEEDDTDELLSQKFDDNISEGRTKMDILNNFVEEQLGYVQPEKQGPADVDFLNDSDDEDNQLEPHEPTHGEANDDARDWKLANLLGPQTGREANRRSRSRGASAVDLRFQDSRLSQLNSSTHLTLRTSSHPRDDDFVGRDGDLANLYKKLSTPGRICILNGSGGVGKTHTAVEYTYRYEQSFSYVFWTQAETRVGCADTFSLIAVALELAPDGEDQKQLIELGRDFLETTGKKWLLVFDNVDDWSDIEEYIPVNMGKTNGSILITTRAPGLGPNPVPANHFRVDLKEMSMQEGQSLLIQGIQSDLKFEKVRFHPEFRLAGEIAGLAGLPLAISHIAGYVKASGCTLAEFLELWNEWRRNNLSAEPTDQSIASYEALGTIWNIGLSELGVESLRLLKIMAFVDSDNIQRDLLINDHTVPALAFLRASNQFR